jgi:hypothetical protein
MTQSPKITGAGSWPLIVATLTSLMVAGLGMMRFFR